MVGTIIVGPWSTCVVDPSTAGIVGSWTNKGTVRLPVISEWT